MKQKPFEDILGKKLKEYIATGGEAISVTGVTEAFTAWLLSGLGNRRILVVTESEMEAKKLAEDIRTFAGMPVLFLPGREISFYEAYAHSRETESERIRVLGEIARHEAVIVTTSVNNLMIPYRRPDDFKKDMKTLDWGKRQPIGDLLSFLAGSGYESVDQVQAKGQFSRRGGILDIFSPQEESPYRIEFFDDEVDSIRIFDVSSQISTEKRKSAVLLPAREAIMDAAACRLVAEKVGMEKRSLVEKVSPGLLERYDGVIESLFEGTFSGDAFNYFCYLPHARLEAYFGEGALVAFWDEKRISRRAEAYHAEFLQRYRYHLEKEKILSGQHLLVREFEPGIFRGTKVFFDQAIESRPSVERRLDFAVKPQEGFKGRLDELIKYLAESKEKGFKTIVYAGGKDKTKRLQAELFNRGLDAFLFDEDVEAFQNASVAISKKSLSRGFVYKEGGWNILSEMDVFGVEKKHKKMAPDVKKRAIKSFTDLKPGDYVVHENHGIGRFLGIKQLEVDKIRKDYLQLAYQKGDYLYVPVNQMGLIQKYLGSDNASPKLNRLGGIEWQRTKQRARKSIEDLTEGLLELYAKRKTVAGHSFMEDSNWQIEFEDLFEYDETPDQLKTIAEIKRDMEKPLPMDRLLCGDVGYGKTEVALRAAFKAVNDGKQVAILVPTTILAQQHYNTVQKRMGPFPVKVEMLSRFRSKARQDKIIDDLRRGSVDLVVGTHRLLSSDIRFKDLGLLIVDEEQRFGVKHKERLKELKSSIDVLSLSATPIPRTLHMSLVGIRDISVIEDPPDERYPVETFVMEKNDDIVREAIVKELERQGQVYFVHNRIRDIEQVAAKVVELVPHARVAYAHGQMNERKLEDIMIDFLNRDIDVLVCTTIIETGLDIANVNTILIDHADHMGLSQLYQLRGRVGRSNRMARAYLMYERGKSVSQVAEERLKAIKEFTELGSGFKIAMRDLEIRGTGNLLGPQQHGQMEAVGYDLYVKMMEEAIFRMKGERMEIPVDTSVEIRISAFIPDSYIFNEAMKLETYKRISSIETKADYHNSQEEIEDRYGTLPQEVYNLLDVSYLKALAGRFGITDIRENESFYRFDMPAGERFGPEKASKILKAYPSQVHLHAGEAPYILYRFKGKQKSQEEKLKEAIEFMEKINSFNDSSVHI